jgi:hypothetical protein
MIPHPHLLSHHIPALASSVGGVVHAESDEGEQEETAERGNCCYGRGGEGCRRLFA